MYKCLSFPLFLSTNCSHCLQFVDKYGAAATAMPQSGRGPCQGPGDEPGTVPLWPDVVDLLVWRGMLVDHGARFSCSFAWCARSCLVNF